MGIGHEFVESLANFPQNPGGGPNSTHNEICVCLPGRKILAQSPKMMELNVSKHIIFSGDLELLVRGDDSNPYQGFVKPSKVGLCAFNHRPPCPQFFIHKKHFRFMWALIMGPKGQAPASLYLGSHSTLHKVKTQSTIFQFVILLCGHNIIKQCVFIHVGLKNIIMRCRN